MPNFALTGHAPNSLHGTITAGGTLTSQIDLMEYSLIGLMTTTSMTAGTLTFYTTATDNGQLVAIKDSSGTNVSIGPVSGLYALKATDLAFLAPYRYVRISIDRAQASGLEFTLPVKA